MASKRRLRKKEHDGKIAYTREAADQHSRSLFGRSGEFVKAYKCHFGHHWHIGHYKTGSHRVA